MTKSQEFIKAHKKILVSGPAFYNTDTSLMTVEQYERARCRILVIFPTPMANKTVSSTAAAVNDFVIEHCPDTFVDFAYLPESEDTARYDKYGIPYAIGNITHLDASHFDIIGFSISVLSDILSGPVIMNTFSRCDKPIPAFWSDRKDAPLGTYPIIYAGGITAAYSDVCFGKVGDKQSFYDFLYLGACDKTDILTNRFIEAMASGKCTRNQSDHDIPGYEHKDIEGLDLTPAVKTIQDYIEAQFDCEWIYQPQAYDVKYDKHCRICSNKKINPKARDWVRPYYPHILPEDMGIGRTIINANGDLAGTAQTQVSEGCSAAGSCSFRVAAGTRIWTNFGICRIETLNHARVAGLHLNEGSKEVKFQGRDRKVIVTTKDGYILECDNNHKWLVVSDDHLVERRTNELVKGDVVLRRLGSEPNTGSGVTTEFAEFLGFMHGDGCFGKSYGRKNARWKIYMTDGERPRYEELFRKFVPTKAKTRVHYKSDVVTIYVVEGNAVDFGYDIAAVPGMELYVPDCIFSSSDNVRRAYLRGIFQADGWFTNDLGLTTISKQYAQDIAVLLNSVGIDCTIRTNEFFGRNEYKGHKVSYYILVPKPYQKKFIDEIGFVTKNHEVSEIENRTKANLPNTLHISDFVRSKLKRDDAREMGMGEWFERPHHNISDSNWRSIPEWALSGLGEKSVRRMVASGNFVTDCIESVYITDDVVDMYDVVDTDSSWCVYNSILTHNCAEGNYCSGWTEKTRERILWECRECKKYSAGYKYKPYSFNSNYLTDYKGMLKEFMQIYPKVSFINMRMEELGRDTDAVKMMKTIGSNRLAAPMEGFSPRIQNNLLNKCLSTESLNNFMNYLVHAKILELKCVVKDTLTPTALGLLTQEKLTDGLELLPHKNIVHVIGSSVEPTRKVVFSLGNELEGTFEHRVLTKPELREESFTELRDLKVGDTVYLQTATSRFGDQKVVRVVNHCKALTSKQDTREFDIVVDEHFAFMLGWCVGDGSVETTLSGSRDRVRFYFNENELPVAELIKAYLNSLGYEPKLVKHTSTTYELGVYSKNFAILVESLVNRRSYGKCVPAEILESPFNVQSAFLRGLFSADGTIVNCKTVKRTDISMSTVNHSLALTVQQMLFNMGVVSSIKTVRPKCGGKVYTAYQVSVRFQHVPMFLDCVGFEGYKKSIVPEYTAKLDSIKSVNGFTPVKVVSFEDSEAEVYKFITSDHTYVTNSVVSHNCGGIYTGYEEDQDFQWLYDFIKSLKDRAAEEGGNFPIRLNVTPLVHYPLTPLEYLERKTARRSYEEQRWFTDFWYDKYKEVNLRIKIHGFRFSTFIEQSIIDLGRLLTPLFYKHFIADNRPIYTLRSVATPEFIQDLKSLIDPEYHFRDRDPEHYISPCHRIRIEMFGSYIPRARRLLRHKRAGSVFDNEPDIRCLKTYDGAVTKCYANCIKNDPLRIYDDVEMDEEGNLSGHYFELTGCMRCQSAEEKRMRVARPTPQTANSDDIAATPSIPRVQKIRFIIKRNPEYDLLDPGNTSHTFVAKFLQESDLLLDSYHSVNAHNMFWQAGPSLKYFCSGFQIVDTVWSKNVIEEVRRLIPTVNSKMKSLQILSATDVFMDEKLDVNDYNIFYFETELPTEVLQQAALEYKGEIRVDVGTSAAVEMGTIVDKTLGVPVFTKVKKTCGFFALPLKYNPVNYFSSFVSTAKKLGMDLIASNTDFECVLCVRTTNIACRNCGKENGVISLTTGKTLPFGPNCLCKALMTQKTKNGI